MKYSIRIRYALMVAGLIISTIAGSILLNLCCFETYYFRNKENTIRDMYRLIEDHLGDGKALDTNAELSLRLYCENANLDLLILDELSYLSFNRHQSELLFKVISDRSEKSSTIVTTNLPFSKWTDLFENTTMVAAMIDRLTFRSHVLDMNGDSYRLKATMQKQA